MSSYSILVKKAEAGWETARAAVEMSPVKIYLRKRRRGTDEGKSPNRWGEAFSLKYVVLTTPGPGTSYRRGGRNKKNPEAFATTIPTVRLRRD